jgi:hypothetical protein
LWFKAAVIAVPIAGGFILVMLIVLAVRMLRHDSRRHREYKHNQSLHKAQLYVADHFSNTNHLLCPDDEYKTVIPQDQCVYSTELLKPDVTYDSRGNSHCRISRPLSENGTIGKTSCCSCGALKNCTNYSHTIVDVNKQLLHNGNITHKYNYEKLDDSERFRNSSEPDLRWKQTEFPSQNIDHRQDGHHVV